MEIHVAIPQNTYNAIMGTAARAYRRECWLSEAADLHEATGAPTAEIIEGFFVPFCDRLIKEATFDRSELSEDAARFGFFKQFSELVI